MLTPIPHALDIDTLGQIPDLLRRVHGVCIVSVHDAGVVEHDVNAAPGVEMLDDGFDVGFFGDVASPCLQSWRVR